MIELVIAALIQLGTLTTDGSTATQGTSDVPTTTTTTTTDADPGGTGNWDDNG